MTSTLTVPRAPETNKVPRRKRPRDIRPEDVWVFFGCLASAVAIVWLLFDQFTALSGPFGFVVCSVVAFLVIFWVVTVQLHGRLVANDRLLSAAVAIGTMVLAIPLVLMMVFLVQKGWGLLSVHLFYKDLKGVGPLSPPGPVGCRWPLSAPLSKWVSQFFSAYRRA